MVTLTSLGLSFLLQTDTHLFLFCCCERPRFALPRCSSKQAFQANTTQLLLHAREGCKSMLMPHWLKILLAYIACELFFRYVAAAPLSQQRGESVACDVIIAGGSLASLAAAVSAANYSSALTVCFLEPTDWPGGQLTASAVPAVDFGPHNRNPANVAQSFASFLFGPSMPGDANLGDCWVSLQFSSNAESTF